MQCGYLFWRCGTANGSFAGICLPLRGRARAGVEEEGGGREEVGTMGEIGFSSAPAGGRTGGLTRRLRSCRRSLIHFAATEMARRRKVEVGDIVCPRPGLASGELRRRGVYRHVNYRVEVVEYEQENGSREKLAVVPQHADKSRVYLHIRPVDRLLPRFEKEWPVVVSIAEGCIVSFWDDIFITSGWYLQQSLFLVAAALLFRNVFSIAYVPSESMNPTLRRGDAVLVEFVSSQILPSCRHGEIVFFRPPEKLREYVRNVGNTELKSRDLFVKRIAACPGEDVEVLGTGEVTVNGMVVSHPETKGSERKLPIKPSNYHLSPGQVFLLGDNPSHSIDSRFWGPMNRNNIVARPLFHLWNTIERTFRVEQLR